MAHKTAFAEFAKLCVDNNCAPGFRSETVGDRVHFSLTATEAKTDGKRLYDLRNDYAFEEAMNAGDLFDEAQATWFK